MNYGMIAHVLSWILSIEGVLMLPSCLVALIYKEKAGLCLLITLVICLLLGLVRLLIKPKKKAIYAREGFVIVALSWLLLSIFGALPFRISGYIPHMVDAVFETASGFTTTGASILTVWKRCPIVFCSGEALPTGSAEWACWSS